MSPRITNTEFRILDSILSFADSSTDEKGDRREGGNCFPSQNQTAKSCGKASRTVQKVLANLEEKGWIRRVQFQRAEGRGRTSDLYQFLIPDNEEDGPLRGPLWWRNREKVEPVLGRGSEPTPTQDSDQPPSLRDGGRPNEWNGGRREERDGDGPEEWDGDGSEEWDVVTPPRIPPKTPGKEPTRGFLPG